MTCFALAAILVTSLGLRLWGSGFGLPAFAHYHPDEHALVERALAILQTGEWQPERLNYPPFYAYVQVAAYAGLFLAGRGFGLWHDLLPFPLPEYYHLSRIITALLGTLTGLVTYLAGRQLFSRQVGLLAAALLGGNYLHIIHSHYATLDVAMGFWVALALLFSIRGMAGAGWGSLFLASLCAGLAGATKYNGAVALVLPLAALLIAAPGASLGRRLTGLAPVAAGGVLGFFGANPLAVAHWDQFVAGLAAVGLHYAGGQPGFEGLGNWLWYLGILFTSADSAWAAAGLAGLLAAAFSSGRRGLLLLAFPAVYFGLVSSFVVRFERNLVPILPFLALGGAWLLSRGAGWLASHRRLPVPTAQTRLSLAGAALMLALPVAAGVALDRQLARPDHREVAGGWLEENAAPGSQIAIEHYAIPFGHSAYDVTDVVRIGDHDLAWYQAAGFDLLVVSDGVWELLQRQRRYYGDRVRAYEQLTAGCGLLAEFVPDPPGLVVAGYPSVAVYHFAPVRIYRVPGES